MRFRRIQLANWRNFRHADVVLNQRAFVIGPNAAGKSNFLDAFRFLQDVASVGGGLQKAIRERGGTSRVRCLGARKYPDIEIAVEIEDDESQANLWKYKLAIHQDNNRRPLIRREEVFFNDQPRLARPDDEDRADPERLSQTHLEQVNANKAFRDVVEFLASIQYMHVVPQLVRNPRLATDIGRIAIFGGDFLERLARATQGRLASRLKRIEQALQIAVPNLRELRIERDDSGVPHLLGRYEHWRPNAGWQNEAQFSDGTLRLMGLLWSVMDGRGPLLLEEPELSLHPAVVRFIPQMLHQATKKTRRQLILSTHSPDLLRDEGIAPDETILLRPTANGTDVSRAADDDEILALLEGGHSMADAALPRTAPPAPEQLSLLEVP